MQSPEKYELLRKHCILLWLFFLQKKNKSTHLDSAFTSFFKGQAIQDGSWGKFGVILQYKAEWYGTNIIQIGRFEPSYKMSDCGYIHKALTLAERTWTCLRCATEYERDLQAAKNIKKFALKNYVSGTDIKIRNKLPTLVGVLTYEAAIRLG